MDTPKRVYETTFIINSYLEDAHIESIISKVEDTLAKNSVQINVFDRIGRKRLAYPIKKKNNGYYCYIVFEATPDFITKLERVYQLDEGILRYLTVVLDKKALAAQSKKRETKKDEVEAEAIEVPENEVL
jgi:small subunit ribosomal protein S6